jgi:hypothetical protein
MITVDQNDLYITGVLYQGNAYPDSSVPVFEELDTNFRTISGLYYSNFCVNRSECRMSDSSTREQLLIFLKGVTLNGSSFLTDAQSDSLRTSIMQVLNTTSDITYFDVEMRTSREITP